MWTIVLLINVQIYKADHIMVPWAYFDSPFPMRQIALFCVEISNLCLWKFLNFSVIHHSSVIHKHTQYERFISILMFRHVLCGTFTDMVYVKDSYIDSQGVNSHQYSIWYINMHTLLQTNWKPIWAPYSIDQKPTNILIYKLITTKLPFTAGHPPQWPS